MRTRKQKIIIDTDSDSETAEILPEVPEKPKAAVRGRTRKIDVELEEDDQVMRPHMRSWAIQLIVLCIRYFCRDILRKTTKAE